MRPEDKKKGILILSTMLFLISIIVIYNIFIIRGRRNDLNAINKKKAVTTVGYIYKTTRAGKGLDNNSYPCFDVLEESISGNIPFVSRAPLPLNAPIAVKYYEDNPNYYKIIKDTTLYSTQFKFEYKTIKEKNGIWAGDYECVISEIK